MKSYIDEIKGADEVRAREILIRFAFCLVKQMKEAEEEMEMREGDIGSRLKIWKASTTAGGLEIEINSPTRIINRINRSLQKYKDAYDALKFLDIHVRRSNLDGYVPLPKGYRENEFSVWPVNLGEDR